PTSDSREGARRGGWLGRREGANRSVARRHVRIRARPRTTPEVVSRMGYRPFPTVSHGAWTPGKAPPRRTGVPACGFLRPLPDAPYRPAPLHLVHRSGKPPCGLANGGSARSANAGDGVDSGEALEAGNDLVEVSGVGDVHRQVNGRLAISGPGADVADVASLPRDHIGDGVEHAGVIVAVDHELDELGLGRRRRPGDVNAAIRLVEQVAHVGTGGGVHRDAFAAGDVADDGLAMHRSAAGGAVYQQVAEAADEDRTAGAGRARGCGAAARLEAAGLVGSALRRRNEFGENLPGGDLAVAEAGIDILGLGETELGAGAADFRLGELLEADLEAWRVALEDAAADLSRALALVDVEPMPDLLTCS